MPRSSRNPRILAVGAALALAAVLPVARLAAAAPEGVRVTQGTLTYHIDHRFKSFDGVMPASAAELWLEWDPTAPEGLTFTATIPLGAFDSANELRDEHAAEALELFVFPDATWRADQVEVVEREPAAGVPDRATLRVSGPLSLHGVTATLAADVVLTRVGDAERLQTRFTLSLTDFDIERPGLLGFRIHDEVPVTVDLMVPLPAGR